jgi:DNA-binding protein HU-beta
MNKSELIDAIAGESGLTKVDSKKALDGFMKVVKETLKTGDKVVLVGFGSWDVHQRNERSGINPQTKQKITIAAKKVVRFKVGNELNGSVH